MFTITQVVKYLGADGKPAKADYTRSWDDMEKITAVVDFEQAILRGLTQLSNLSVYALAGKGPVVTSTKPVEMQIDFLFLDTGKKWFRMAYEFPKVGEEQQVLILGTIDGELSMMPGTSRGKEVPKKRTVTSETAE